MHLLIIVLVVVLIVGLLPSWPYSKGFGYYPSTIGVVVLILVLVWLFGFGGARRF